MPREQFIAPAGVAAGDPFFCWVSFRWTSLWWFPFWWASSRWAFQDGRDLLLCYSLAFRDRFSAEYRLKVVGICHPTTARQIPTISPAPHASRRQTSRPRRTLPIGKSAQIETFVATRDAKLFR